MVAFLQIVFPEYKFSQRSYYLGATQQTVWGIPPSEDRNCWLGNQMSNMVYIEDFCMLHGGQPQRNLQAKTDLPGEWFWIWPMKTAQWSVWVPWTVDLSGSLEGMAIHLGFIPTR